MHSESHKDFPRVAIAGPRNAQSLFVGSPEAGPPYAALLTLALNCALREVNPYDYFVELFDRLASGWPRARIAELLPQRRLAANESLEQPQA